MQWQLSRQIFVKQLCMLSLCGACYHKEQGNTICFGSPLQLAVGLQYSGFITCRGYHAFNGIYYGYHLVLPAMQLSAYMWTIWWWKLRWTSGHFALQCITSRKCDIFHRKVTLLFISQSKPHCVAHLSTEESCLGHMMFTLSAQKRKKNSLHMYLRLGTFDCLVLKVKTMSHGLSSAGYNQGLMRIKLNTNKSWGKGMCTTLYLYKDLIWKPEVLGWSFLWEILYNILVECQIKTRRETLVFGKVTACQTCRTILENLTAHC